MPCEVGTPPLTVNETRGHKKDLKLDWEVLENTKIKHEFKFKDFKLAMVFVNKVADIAESQGHHPNIKIFYSRVIIELTTHSIKGLSPNDFYMAAKIENI